MKMKGAQIFVCIIVVAAGSVVNCQVNESEHREILNFIEKCEAELVFGDVYKNVVLVLGNTGAGKSTFTQWIAGNDPKLISVEVLESGEYIIVDNDKIGTTTAESKTVFPELLVDNDTDTAYYDISGFSDTRGTKHDISTSYFVKRIIDHVDSIKVLLVVSHSSVRKGVDRLDFMRLLRHFTDLMKNIDKYVKGIGLVVTKVENIYRKGSNGESTLVSDSSVVSSIAAFLLEMGEYLKQNKESSTATSDDKLFYEKALVIINSLLFSEKQSYERIVLFRRPDQLGPLNSIYHLQQAKSNVRNMVSNKLQFVPKSSDDFSYTVSDETKNKLNYLLKDLENILEDNVKAIAFHILDQFEPILKDKLNKNFTLDLNDLDLMDSDLLDIKRTDIVIHDISELALNISDVKKSQLIPSFINETVNRIVVDMPEWIIVNISSVAHFLDFIETTAIVKFKLNTLPLQVAFQEVKDTLDRLSIKVKERYEKLLIDVENDIKSNIQRSINQLKDQFDNREKNILNIKELSKEIQKQCDNFKNLNFSDPNATLSNIINVFVSCDITLQTGVQSKIRKEEKYYLFFKHEIEILVTYLNDSNKWYRFLNILYDKLSGFEIQKDKDSKRQCSSFIQNSNTMQLFAGKNVNETNIEFFLKECYNDLYDEEYTKVKYVYLTHYFVKLLQDVVRYTLDDAFSQTCNESKLVVKDRFVKISAINISECFSITSLEVLGSEKVFIDDDLDLTGMNIQMVVMAPIWEVIGERKIILNGLPGEKILPTKADDEKQGLPGKPGENGGDFLGFGNEFINGENLFIFANGGDGSDGQDGGDGTPGVDDNYRRVVDREDLSCNYIFIYCSDYTESSGYCSNGGNSRVGGLGGEGGKSGKVEVFGAPFKVIAEDGLKGIEGSTGTPGRAGRSTEIENVSVMKLWLLFGSVPLKTNIQRNMIRCYSGRIDYTYDSDFEYPAVPRKSDLVIDAYFSDFYYHLENNLKSSLRSDIIANSMNSVKEHFNNFDEMDVVTQKQSRPRLVELGINLFLCFCVILFLMFTAKLFWQQLYRRWKAKNAEPTYDTFKAKKVK